MLDEHLNANFDQRVVVPAPQSNTWVASPGRDVYRHRLDRIGGEVARATSIVRIEAGSRFAHHAHGGGEEILVLHGLLHDDQGTYPAGTWLRNPRRNHHAQHTAAEGALIYVKLGHLGRALLRAIPLQR